MRKDFFNPRKSFVTRYYMQVKLKHTSLLYESEFVIDFEESSIADLRKTIVNYLRVWNVELVECSELYVVTYKTAYDEIKGFNLTSDIKNLLKKGEE